MEPFRERNSERSWWKIQITTNFKFKKSVSPFYVRKQAVCEGWGVESAKGMCSILRKWSMPHSSVFFGHNQVRVPSITTITPINLCVSLWVLGTEPRALHILGRELYLLCLISSIILLWQFTISFDFSLMDQTPFTSKSNIFKNLFNIKHYV